MTFAFASNQALRSGKKETTKNESGLEGGGYEVRTFMSSFGKMAKNLPNESAVC